MKKKNLPFSITFFFVVFFTTFTNAQDSLKSRTTISRWGYYFSLDGGWSSQRNLNFVLKLNNQPATRNFQAGFSAGWLYKPSRFEAALDASFFSRAAERNDIQQERMNLMASLNAKYLIGKKSFRWYPMIGIGASTGINRLTPENSTTDLSTALTTGRNTTSLYNREGVATVALGFRFKDDSIGRFFSGMEVGYRLGFSTTLWSTRITSSNMTNSVPDELRQFYVRLLFGFFKRSRS